jgi:hypothetical protein
METTAAPTFFDDGVEPVGVLPLVENSDVQIVALLARKYSLSKSA